MQEYKVCELVMENFTAIYSTELLKDIHYSFEAKDMESAILYCQEKFDVPVEIKRDIEMMLKFEPVRIFQKENQIMPTANLGDTEFINHYRGSGEGIAYVVEKNKSLYVVAFNYGDKVLFSNYKYSRVNFSCTQLCFLAGVEKSIDDINKEKELISEFVKSLEKVIIFGKEFLSCKKYPKEIENFKTKTNFGFVQQGSFIKRHKDNGYGDYVSFLPSEGAYEAYILDRNKIAFTWGLGRNNENVIQVETLYFYDGNKKYEVFVNPNVQEIEKKLNDCFGAIPQESISNDLKVRFVYKHNPLV